MRFGMHYRHSLSIVDFVKCRFLAAFFMPRDGQYPENARSNFQGMFRDGQYSISIRIRVFP